MPIIPDNLIGIFKKTADNLKGSAKRVFMGEVVSQGNCMKFLMCAYKISMHW